MSEENIEQVALEQRATDPRLEVPVAEAPIESVDGEEPAPVVVEPPKPKKTAEEVLKGRVGHLTKTLSAKDEVLSAKDQEIADYKSKLAAADALLASSGQTPEQRTVTTSTTPNYSPADFEAAVNARAEVQEFNRKADDMYNAGAAKFDDWKDAVDTLVVSGFMNKDLLDSAMAIEEGTTVLHYLGTNLDEAERISALPPIRKAAEMARLSTALTTPKSIPVSNAPAPIKVVNGSPSPQIDLQRISDTEDMRSYIAARAKQGSRWAQARGQRA